MADSPPRTPISAVMITLDAQRLLDGVVASVAWCDEVVVVDAGSTDATLEIARRHGCRILHRDFDGFGSQKGFAVRSAAHDWILSVDADEIVPRSLAAEIRAAVDASSAGRSAHRGFTIPRTLVFLGREMRNAGDAPLRLFDRRAGSFTSSAVHERVEVRGTVGALRHRMVHDSYSGIHDYFARSNAYTTAAAREMYARGKRVGAAQTVGRFPVAFIREYLLRGGFLDGYPGFVWSLFSAIAPVMKYAKLRELYRRGARAGENP